MKIKAVVFDKDGTLLDYEKCWLPIARVATDMVLKRYNAPELREEIYSRLGILSDGSVDIEAPLATGSYVGVGRAYADTLDAHGIKYDVPELTAIITDGYHTVPEDSQIVPICDNLAEILVGLRARGIKIGFITSDDAIGAKRTLDSLGIYDLFDVGLANDRVSPQKPHPHYMSVFMEKTGLSKEEILMVGDTFADIEFGKNSGTLTLGVARTEKNRDKLMGAADYVRRDISHVFEVIDIIEGTSV